MKIHTPIWGKIVRREFPTFWKKYNQKPRFASILETTATQFVVIPTFPQIISHETFPQISLSQGIPSS